MGITIHFEGKLKNEENYEMLIEKAVEFSKYHEWDYFLFNNENKILERVRNEKESTYKGPTKGIQLQPHENSEPLIFEFDDELYIQDIVKRNFQISKPI